MQGIGRAAGVFPRQLWPAAPGCPTADSSGSQPPTKTPAGSATWKDRLQPSWPAPPVVQLGARVSLDPATRSGERGRNKLLVVGVGMGGSGAGSLGLRLGVPIQVLP